jgi:hypothetical protein
MAGLRNGAAPHPRLATPAPPQGEGRVRALACHGAALYSGGTDGKVRAWDL